MRLVDFSVNRFEYLTNLMYYIQWALCLMSFVWK